MATPERKLDLSSQQKELVAVGASVGAGCHPCVSHHLRAGAKAGLDDEQLLAAVASAERVSAEAAVLMGDHVRGTLRPDVTPALLSRVEEVLASLGAALGSNDKTNIEHQLKAAAELGVAPGQLREAIETARIVQENATRIHVREAERLLDSLEASEEPPSAKPAAETSAGCGPAGGECDSGGFAAMMAGFCEPSGGPDGTTGPAAAMEKCRSMFGRGSEPAPAATPVEPPAAPESAGSCGEGC